MTNWKVKTLGELCVEGGGGIQTGPFGSQLHASDYVDDGVPSVMPQNIADNMIDISGIAHVSETDAHRLAKYRLRTGDIVYSRRGDVGKRALVRPQQDGWLCGTGCLRVRLGCRSTDFAPFIAYALGTEEARHWIARHAVGGTMLNLNTSILSAVPLRLPEPATQMAIAEVLGALDDKIAANNRLISALTQYTAAEFRRAVHSLKERVALGSLSQVTKGASYRSLDLAPSCCALVTLKCFLRTGGYTTAGLKPFIGTYKSSQRFNSGEIAVAQTDLTQGADVIGRAIRVPPSREYSTLVASLDVAIVRPLSPVPGEFLLGVLLDGSFREHCKTRTSGTTVLHLSSDAIPSYQAPNATPDIQKRYASLVRPVLQLQDSLAEETRRLSATRDSLLPDLMSGRLRVKDAEAVAEETL